MPAATWSATTAAGRRWCSDVDDTALSTYDCLKEVGFVRSAGRCADTATLPAVPQVHALYRRAPPLQGA